jgi:hypothetical protein
MATAPDHLFIAIFIEIADILLQVRPSPPYESFCKSMQANSSFLAQK